MPRLQQLVFLLSVAIKDADVVRLLIERGSGLYQTRLLEYSSESTEEERQTWEMIRDDSALRRLGIAAFLKIVLPIETMAESGGSEAVP